MTRRRKVAAALVAAALILACGFYALDRALYGIPSFYVWRLVSGEYRGSHRASIDGVSIYYEVYGSGPPVLVLHGAGAFLETMHYFISGLAPNHTVIAVDSRAQGRSTDSATPLTYGLMGDDMLGLMKVLHLQSADVVGWSDGGIVALDMAMKSTRPRRIVAIGVNYDANGVDPREVSPQTLAEIAREIEPFYRLIAPDPSHFPILMRKIDIMVRTQPHYTLSELSRIRARTLIMAGQYDAIRAEHTARLAAAIPGATRIIVAGASHMGPLEKPRLYNRIVADFLAAP